MNEGEDGREMDRVLAYMARVYGRTSEHEGEVDLKVLTTMLVLLMSLLKKPQTFKVEGGGGVLEVVNATLAMNRLPYRLVEEAAGVMH